MRTKCLTNQMLKLGASSIVFLVALVWSLHPALAIDYGKVYDKSNGQEIEKNLPPSMNNWIKQGKISLTVSKLDFDFGIMDSPFSKKSLANQDKYGFDAEGLLIEKPTGKQPIFVEGLPFPSIDQKDPNVAQKIMENNVAMTEHATLYQNSGTLEFIGKGGLEKTLVTPGRFLYYFQRLQGPIPNPNKFRKQDMEYVASPMELRGTAIMNWEYIENKENAAFAYVPMLRRVRRTATSARSDPFMGSEQCPDDIAGWGGKNNSMKWKLIGEGEMIVPLAFTEKVAIKTLEDGSFERKLPATKVGYEVPGWKQALWNLVDAKWAVRPVWIVEGTPKDPYYNYGKLVCYIDKGAYTVFYKELFDKAGQYWKTISIAWSCQSPGDDVLVAYAYDLYFSVDDKTQNATVTRLVEGKEWRNIFNLPLNVVGPDDFNESRLVQISK